jgi:hypothetical protein
LVAEESKAAVELHHDCIVGLWKLTFNINAVSGVCKLTPVPISNKGPKLFFLPS